MAFDTNSFSFGIKVWGDFLSVNPDINSLFSVTVFKVNLAGLLDHKVIAFYQTAHLMVLTSILNNASVGDN